MKVNKKSNEFTSFDIANSKEAAEVSNAIDEATSNNYEVKIIRIEDIEFNPQNTRFNSLDTDETIRALADNLQENGLVSPISVFPHGDKYMLISGERRTKAFKLLGKRYIPANILEDAGELGNMERLYYANLESRPLDSKTRFFAVKDLLDKYKELSISTPSDNQLAKKVQLTLPTFQRYKELYQNSPEGDFELLATDEISMDEFTRRTMEIISEREKSQLARRIELISQRTDKVEPTNYIDPTGRTVYSVECDDDGKYCTAVTDKNLFKVPLHYQNQVFPSFEEAQIALDLFAKSNKCIPYTGDFSEFKDKPASPLSSVTAEDPSSDDSDKIDETKFGPSIFESYPEIQVGANTDDLRDEAENTNENSEDSAESVVEAESEPESESAAHDEDVNSEVVNDEARNETVVKTEKATTKEAASEDAATQPVKTTRSSDLSYLNQLSSFIGYGIEDHLPHSGALVCSVTGHTYIITKLEIESCVVVGKATRKSDAYFVEVDPKTIVKTDIINQK